MRVLIAALAFPLVLAGAAPALAHGAAAEARALGWTWDPLVLALLGIASAWYAAGFWRMRRHHGSARAVGGRHVAAYAAGILTLIAALVSPLHEASEQLLSLHMIQHLLLLFAAPALLVYGRPAIVCLWALPPAGRKGGAWLWSSLGLKAGMRALMHPLVVWALYCGSFVVWHLPRLYELALRDEGIHTLEHASFFVTALMFWSLVIEMPDQRRLGYGATLLLIVHTAILSGMPGALIALAPRPIYPAYAAGVAAWGLTLMQDQQLAGVIMWVPAGLVYLAAASVTFVRWLNDAERQNRSLIRRAAPLALVAILPLLLLSGCGRQNTEPETMARSGGDRHHGAELIRSFHCGACHTIPGIENADGLVGPPLDHMGKRIYIAGLLRNTPENMMTWVQHPQAVVPGNAMPDMGIDARDARDVVAYLDALR